MLNCYSLGPFEQSCEGFFCSSGIRSSQFLERPWVLMNPLAHLSVDVRASQPYRQAVSELVSQRPTYLHESLSSLAEGSRVHLRSVMVYHMGTVLLEAAKSCCGYGSQSNGRRPSIKLDIFNLRGGKRVCRVINAVCLLIVDLKAQVWAAHRWLGMVPGDGDARAPGIDQFVIGNCDWWILVVALVWSSRRATVFSRPIPPAYHHHWFRKGL